MLVEEGNIDAADKELRQAVLMDDQIAEGLYFLGRALIAEKKLSEAVESLESAASTPIRRMVRSTTSSGSPTWPARSSSPARPRRFTHSTEKDPKNADAWEQARAALS